VLCDIDVLAVVVICSGVPVSCSNYHELGEAPNNDRGRLDIICIRGVSRPRYDTQAKLAEHASDGARYGVDTA
jgi:hypothetical protein